MKVPAPAVSATVPSIAVLAGAVFMVAWDPWWAVNYAGPMALLAVVLNGTRLRPRLRLPDVLALLTGAWALATLLWTSRPDLAFGLAGLYAMACLTFVVCRHLIRTRQTLLVIGGAYLAGCGLSAIEVIRGARRALSGQGEVVDFTNRYGIDGVNVNYTAYTLVTGLVVACLLATQCRQSAKVVPIVCIPLLGYATLLTGSRGAALGLALATTALTTTRLAPRLTAYTTALITPTLIIITPLGLLPPHLTTWLDELYGRPTGNISGRLDIWPLALTTWTEKLLTGWGPAVYLKTNPLEVGAHNLLLTLGNDLGLIGALLYLGATTTALWTTAHTNHTQLTLTCTFTLALLPIWLTGQWEASLGTWLTLGLLTTQLTHSPLPRHLRSRWAAAVTPSPGYRWGAGQPTTTGPLARIRPR